MEGPTAVIAEDEVGGLVVAGFNGVVSAAAEHHVGSGIRSDGIIPAVRWIPAHDQGWAARDAISLPQGHVERGLLGLGGHEHPALGDAYAEASDERAHRIAVIDPTPVAEDNVVTPATPDRVVIRAAENNQRQR